MAKKVKNIAMLFFCKTNYITILLHLTKILKYFTLLSIIKMYDIEQKEHY